MELSYLTIGIKNKNIEEVKDVLNKSSSYRNINAINNLFGFSITIEDLRDDFLAMKKFLKENDLRDDKCIF